MIRFLILGAATLYLGLGNFVSAAEVTFASVLSEMGSRDSLAKFPSPAYTTAEASSYNRVSAHPGNADWFANNDQDNFVRVDTVAVGGVVRHESVLVDLKGPGCLTRFWHTRFHYGKIRFYLDGSPIPIIDTALTNLIEGKTFIHAPFVFEAGPRTPNQPPDGMNFFFPIPYAKRCRITYEFDIPNQAPDVNPFFYNIEYRTYDASTSVKTFTLADNAGASALIQSVAASLSPHTIPPQKTRYYSAPAAAEILRSTLAPGHVATADLVSGAHALRFLQVRLNPAQINDAALRALRISLTFDGTVTVDCPLGDFFGSGQGLNPGTNQYQSIDSSGILTCVWTMPYRQTARIAFTNSGTKDLDVACSALSGPWTWDDRSMHFHARYKNSGDFTASRQDFNYLTEKATGVYVGDVLSINNGDGKWWGEGDEKVWVDGDAFPSYFGTGTEDYYGYAYSWRYLYQAPWTMQTAAPRKNDYRGLTVNNRVRLLDGIVFKSALKFDMEVWHWTPSATVNYAVCCFWYAKPTGVTPNAQPRIPDKLRIRTPSGWRQDWLGRSIPIRSPAWSPK